MNAEEIIKKHKGWLWHMARSLEHNIERQKDVYQTGAIAMWRASNTFDPEKGGLEGHCRHAARLKMREYAFGRAPQTVVAPDHPLSRTKASPERKEFAADSDSMVWDYLQTDFPDPSVVYHQAEIMEALKSLSPGTKRYIYYRFWEGKTNQEIKGILGYDPSGLWTAKPYGAKMVLQERLQHLKELVS